MIIRIIQNYPNKLVNLTNMVIRNSIKALLINTKKEILFMSVNDPTTTTKEGKYNGAFWDLIGGKIEEDEEVHNTILREIYEETGITSNHIKLGPIVWYGELDLVLKGVLTRINQRFIVAETDIKEVTLKHLTDEEKSIVNNLKWFSLAEIKTFDGIMYPLDLKNYIEDILKSSYPKDIVKLNMKSKF